jgi:acyl-CoA synthetase (AMP-forming)/AMP-acid ligase II
VQVSRITPRSFVDVVQHSSAAAGDRLAFAFCDSAGEIRERLDHGGLDRAARTIATRLAEVAPAGERALLMFPPGIDFVAAFFGCLYAGTIAVPVYPPQSPIEAMRLVGIVERAAPRAIVSTRAFLDRLAPLFAAVPALAALPRVAIEDPGSPDAWRPPAIDEDTVAFLQFTSGSTGQPRGVVVTHGNLLANQAVIKQRMEHGDHTVFAGWLPVYHDMGLIGNVLQSAYLGVPCYLMSPIDFIRRPAVWLEVISRYRATTSGGPSFAYDLCARRVTEEQAAGLDLSSWQIAFNGAEPVRADVLDRFTARFEPRGFSRAAFYPCYGLAEGTLMVTGCEATSVPAILHVDRQALVGGQLSAPSAVDDQALVGCGRPGDDHEVAIVDHETGTRLAAGHVGEIWVRGPSVARGYWNDAETTVATFGGRLDGRDDYLRTGDAGFVDSRGELYIIGRFKDVIIVRGRNHYPDDIERTVEAASSLLRPGRGVAFGVDRAGEERVVVVYEVSKGEGPPIDSTRLTGDVTEAVAARHGVRVDAVVLVRPGSVPKTSSGKLRRSACRSLYLENKLELVNG